MMFPGIGALIICAEVQIWPRRSPGRRARTRRAGLESSLSRRLPLLLTSCSFSCAVAVIFLSLVNGGKRQIPGESHAVSLYQRRSRDGIMLPDAQSLTVWSFNCASAVPVMRLCLCRTTSRRKYLLLWGALLLFLLFAVKACRWYLVCALRRYLLMQTSASPVNWQLPPRLLL